MYRFMDRLFHLLYLLYYTQNERKDECMDVYD